MALKTWDSCILSLIILTIIYFNARKRTEKAFLHHQLFLQLVKLNMVLIVFDFLSYVFNGRPERLSMFLNYAFNLMVFILVPLAPMIWIAYTIMQIYHDESRVHRLKYPLAILFFINTFFSIASLFTGWSFYVTPNNIYHRGDFFWIHALLCLLTLVYSFLLIIFNRNRLERSHYNALLFFVVPPLIGSIIQSLYYGMTLSWSGMTVSLLIVYFFIQNRNLDMDYLTGVYNRRQLDNYIKKKIATSTQNKTFSVILIDLNDFKQINDTFGHDVGDEALQNAVKIIKSCMRWDDFIARYGGDEFYIILNINDLHRLEARAAQINRAVMRFNSTSNLPYQLNLSMGYDVYPYEKLMNSEEFLKHIDMLMYKNKEEMKSLKNEPSV